MQLVQQIQMKSTPLLKEITDCSKNLYNVATYTVRQQFFKDGTWIRYTSLWKVLKDHPVYLRIKYLCGSHPPQQVLKQVDRNFKAFFNAMKVWKTSPAKFHGRPKLPHYKRKHGRNLVIFTSLQCRVRNGMVLLTQKMMKQGFPHIPTTFSSIKGVRIVPYGDRYNIELIYIYTAQDLGLERSNIIGIDLGLNNLITISDNIGNSPILIKGGCVKSINQYYNKKLAKYKAIAKKVNDLHTTSRLLRLHRKRNNKIRNLFHKASRKVIDHCVSWNIGTIIIGYNEGWKHKVKIGRRNNQNFVSIPFLSLIKQIEYKAEMVGISVIRVSEEYTSQTCSCCGAIRKQNRKYRGLYVCADCGLVLNADVNASRNILAKGIPQSYGIGDRGALNVPVVFTASHNPRIHCL